MGIKKDNISFLNFPDTGLSKIDSKSVISALKESIVAIDPTVIITHDELGITLNPDHPATGKAVFAVAKEFVSSSSSSLKRLLTFHLPVAKLFLDRWGVIGLTENFITTVDIGGQLSRKIEAAECYKSQGHLVKHFKESGLLGLCEENFIERLCIGSSCRGGNDIMDVSETGEVYLIPMPLTSEFYRTSLSTP